MKTQELHLRLRIVLGMDIAIGPGKADLLEGIAEMGSIAAAGRRMQMSYKRAWYLIATLNRCFDKPLVRARKGGRGAGGAELTATGKRVLSLYRRIQARAERTSRAELAALAKLARRSPSRKSRS